MSVPIIKYSFETSTSTVVPNEGSLGSLNDGTFRNSAFIISTDYAVGTKCLMLRNDGQLISNDSFAFDTSFTVCFWFKILQYNTSDVHYIFNFNDSNYNLQFYIQNGSIIFYKNDGINTVTQTTGFVIDNSWHYYSIGYNSITKTFGISRDCVFTSISCPTGYNTLYNSCQFIGIGSSLSSVYLYDDFRVYSSSYLSLTDIQSLFNSFSNSTKDTIVPLIHYTFELISGTTVKNEGMSSSDGTLSTVSCVSTSNPAIGTQCLDLYSGTSCLSVPSIVLSGGSFTVCFWYLKQNSTITENGARVFDLSTALDTTTSEVSVGFVGTTGHMDITIAGTQLVFCTTNCCDGVWRHVAITYDSTSGKYSFYFNGIKCTNSMSGPGVGTAVTRTVCFLERSAQTIPQYATMMIDEFRIYDKTCLSHVSIAQMCGNCMYMTSSRVLLNTVLNSYLPSTTKAPETRLCAKLGNSFVDLNTLYAPFLSGTPVVTCFNTRFNPLSLSNCINFFSADEGVELNGTSVVSWKDYSHNNNNAVSNSAVTLPTYGTNTNGRPCVLFDGITSGQYLYCNGTTTDVTNATFCFVMHTSPTVSGFKTLLSCGGSIIANYIYLYISNLLALNIELYPTSQTSTTPIFTSGVPCIFITTVSFSFGSPNTINIKVYVNGIIVMNVQNKQIISSTKINCSNWYLGNDPNYPSRVLNGGLSSVIIYSSLLSDTEREKIEGYLAWKWWGNGNAILSSTHSYYSVPPQINDIGVLFNPLSYS